MLLVGAALGIMFTLKKRDAVYPLVFIWAYIAIAVKQSEISQLSLLVNHFGCFY